MNLEYLMQPRFIALAKEMGDKEYTRKELNEFKDIKYRFLNIDTLRRNNLLIVSNVEELEPFEKEIESVFWGTRDFKATQDLFNQRLIEQKIDMDNLINFEAKKWLNGQYYVRYSYKKMVYPRRYYYQLNKTFLEEVLAHINEML